MYVKHFVYAIAWTARMSVATIAGMAPVKKPAPQLRPTFLKHWRKKTRLSQEKAAEVFDMDRSNLSRIERAKVPYSQQLLERAADLYKCEPWDLLHVNPLKRDDYDADDGDIVDMSSLMRDANPVERADIIGYARGRLAKR